MTTATTSEDRVAAIPSATMRRALHTSCSPVVFALSAPVALASCAPRRRRGPEGRDRRQGRHQRGLLRDRLLPAVRLRDEHDHVVPRPAQGPPQGRREGAPRPAPTSAAAGSHAGHATSAAARGAASRSTVPSGGTRSTGRRRARCWRRFDALLRRRRRARPRPHRRRRRGVLRRRRPEGDRHLDAAPPPARSASPGSPPRSRRSPPSRGWCLAGGLELALWCDLRIADRGATFGCAERRWGVPLIDGGTQRLPRIAGQGRALDLDADRAHRRGRGGPRDGHRQRGRARTRTSSARSSSPRRSPRSRRRRCSPTAAAVLEGLGLPLERGSRSRRGSAPSAACRVEGAAALRRAARAAAAPASTPATSRIPGYRGSDETTGEGDRAAAGGGRRGGGGGSGAGGRVHRRTSATPPGGSGTTARGSSSRPSAGSPPTRIAPATTTSASTRWSATARPRARRRRCGSPRPLATSIFDFRLTKRIIFVNPSRTAPTATT